MIQAFRGAAALLTLACVILCCEPTYLNDKPVLYRDCQSTDDGCTCASDGEGGGGGGAVTTHPEVMECSDASTGGVCCQSDDGGGCDCLTIRCQVTSIGCECGLASDIDGTAAACAGPVCCLDPDLLLCTCSENDCSFAEMEVFECKAAAYDCQVLGDSSSTSLDEGYYLTGVTSCSAGPL